MQTASVPQVPEESDSEINLTPMLDVVFIMLIFFLVTATFVKETGLPVNQPEASSTPDRPASGILIAIADNNEIWIDRRLIDPRAVRANIERLRAENPEATVVIQADKRSHNNTLVQVMNAAREAGVYDIALAREQGDRR
jgi:biopolymer transport protein ExbD